MLKQRCTLLIVAFVAFSGSVSTRLQAADPWSDTSIEVDRDAQLKVYRELLDSTTDHYAVVREKCLVASRLDSTHPRGLEPALPPIVAVVVKKTVVHKVAGTFERSRTFEERRAAHRKRGLGKQQVTVAPESLPEAVEDDAIELVIVVLQPQVDMDLRVELMKRIESRGQPSLGKGGLAADVERVMRGTLADVFDAAVHGGEGRHDLLTQFPTDSGEPDPAMQAFEELHAQLAFQPLDVARDGHRRDAELGGGFLEALEARRRLEGTQGMEI